MDFFFILEVAVGLFGVAGMFYAVLTQFTTLSALGQMGSVQDRTASWASWSKKKSKHLASEISKADAQQERLEAAQLPHATDPSKVRELGHPDSKHQDDAAQTSPMLAAKADLSILENVRQKDKLIFTASVINLILTAYIAGAAPQYFKYWHAPKTLVYISHRYYTFRQQKQHYLLFDYCYWSNLLTLLSLFAFPENDLLARIAFISSNGPLAWAVLSFGQSLVFFSPAHMCSVFIHVSPAMVSYAERWYSQRAVDGLVEDVGAFQLVWETVTRFYGVWLVAYYVFIYIIMDERIRTRGYKTLFDRIISRGPTRHIAKISKNEMVQKTIYMLTHLVFAIATMTLATLYYKYQWLHFLFIITIISASAFNAAGFFFTVFLERYQEDLRERAGIPQPPVNFADEEGKKEK